MMCSKCIWLAVILAANTGALLAQSANPWAQVAVVPPGTNDTRRTVTMPGRVASFAAAPSRLEFRAAGNEKAKQTITAWSDDAALVFAATTGTPWLKVTPAGRKAKTGAQKFTVELAPADLKPGRHQGSIEIVSQGAVNDPIRIPVVVTVAEKTK